MHLLRRLSFPCRTGANCLQRTSRAIRLLDKAIDVLNILESNRQGLQDKVGQNLVPRCISATCTGPKWHVRTLWLHDSAVQLISNCITRATEYCNVAKKISESAVAIHGVYKFVQSSGHLEEFIQ